MTASDPVFKPVPLPDFQNGNHSQLLIVWIAPFRIGIAIDLDDAFGFGADDCGELFQRLVSSRPDVGFVKIKKHVSWQINVDFDLLHLRTNVPHRFLQILDIGL